MDEEVEEVDLVAVVEDGLVLDANPAPAIVAVLAAHHGLILERRKLAPILNHPILNNNMDQEDPILEGITEVIS